MDSWWYIYFAWIIITSHNKSYKLENSVKNFTDTHPPLRLITKNLKLVLDLKDINTEHFLPFQTIWPYINKNVKEAVSLIGNYVNDKA